MLRTLLLTLAAMAALTCEMRAQTTEVVVAAQDCDACKSSAPLCRLPQCTSEPRAVRIGTPRCVGDACCSVYPKTMPQRVVGEHHCPTICAMRQAVKPAPIAKAPAKAIRITPAVPVKPIAEPIVRKPAPVAPQVIVVMANCPNPATCNACEKQPVACPQPAKPAPCQACVRCKTCEPPLKALVCTCRVVSKSAACSTCPQVVSPNEGNVPPPVIKFGVNVPENVPIRSLPEMPSSMSPRSVPSGVQGNFGAVRFDAVATSSFLQEAKPAPAAAVRTVVGQVAHFRKNWHLRYSGVESDDEFGGSVVLSGDNLDRLRDGQILRVTGVITAPTTRGETAVMDIRVIEVLGTNP